MSCLTDLHQAVAELTAAIASQPLDLALQQRLNREYPAEAPLVQRIRAACDQGVAEGLMCQREAGGIRYGRLFKPEEALQGFSVDLVDMQDIAGPQHVHPLGEIDLLMPLNPEASFDGHTTPWVVYGPGSAHRPTVRGGRARVLYLLPQGLIEFARA